MATKKRKQAKPAPRKQAPKTKAKAAPSKAKAAPSKAKAAPSKAKAAPSKAKATVQRKVAAPALKARGPKPDIRRDPGLEAEIAIAIVRGTTIADDGEWVHQDYHIDLPRRHMDTPAWPHTDFLFDKHIDTETPHHDSNKSPGPKPPKKDGPHTDIEAGHLDYGPYHTDIKKGDHSDWMGMPHFDYWVDKDDYHVDTFVGHQDEGTKDPGHVDL